MSKPSWIMRWNYWVNDRAGDPLLVITGDVNAALTRAFPGLLREVRGAVGERRVTIVFDRGGWSPKLSVVAGMARWRRATYAWERLRWPW